ncbi:hypothetical protein [Escherichia phage AV120]|nr:hypothetical protein [Escherichia phage AV120]
MNPFHTWSYTKPGDAGYFNRFTSGDNIFQGAF